MRIQEMGSQITGYELDGEEGGDEEDDDAQRNLQFLRVVLLGLVVLLQDLRVRLHVLRFLFARLLQHACDVLLVGGRLLRCVHHLITIITQFKSNRTHTHQQRPIKVESSCLIGWIYGISWIDGWLWPCICTFCVQFLMKKLQRLSLYEVEAIREGRVDEDGKRFYLVKWKDWEEKFNTWQPIANLSTVRILILDFESQKGNLDDPFKEETGRKKRRGANPAQQRPKSKKQAKKVQGQKSNEVKQGVPDGPQVVKRKRGRPKRIPTEGETGKVKRKYVRKTVAQINEPVQSPSKDAGTQFFSDLPELGQSKPALTHTENVLKVEYLNKRKPISKRVKPIPPSSSPVPVPKAEEPLTKGDPKAEEKQSSEEQEQLVEMEMEGEEEESGGIEQVLLKCKNYTDVRVTFKEDTFFYEIPYEEDGQAASITLTASEINKVNPLWMQGYFQGFYL